MLYPARESRNHQLIALYLGLLVNGHDLDELQLLPHETVRSEFL